MVAAVIFDMDGVLVDSFDAHREAWKATATKEGLAYDPTGFTAMFGRTSREMIAELWGVGRFTDVEIAAMDDRREAAYREIIRANFPAMPGGSQLIHALHKDGVRLALGSSGPPENVALVLQRLNAEW